MTQKNGSGIPDLIQITKGFGYGQFEMLRRNLVDQFYPLSDVPDNNNPSVLFQRLFDNALPGKSLYLFFYFLHHLAGQSFHRCDENRRGRLIMLGLRQQVCGNKIGSSRSVGQDNDLARTGDHVDIDLTEHKLFGCGHVNIPRPHNLIDFFDTLCAVSHGAYGLGSSDKKNLVNPGNIGRHDNIGIDLSPFCRGAHHDLSHTGHPCRYGIHEDRRGIRGLASRNIDTDPP